MKKIQNITFTKIISILIIFFLISTIITPIVSSINLKQNRESNNSSTFFNNINKKTEETKEYQNKKTITQSIKQTVSNIQTLVSLLTGKYTINFHTKYKVYKTDNEMKLFGKTKVDVDNDGDEDISANLRIYPSLIKQPLAISFNFNLIIERLNSLDDNKANFEAYAELYLPGSLFSQNKGDRIRFGYHSERGQTVPEECSVKYVFVPYIIPFLLGMRKPETILEIDPKINSNNDKLNLIFSKADVNNTKVESETKYTLTLDNDISTKLYLGGTDDQEDSKLKIESKNNAKVSLYNEKINSNGDVESSWGVLVEDIPEILEFEYSLRKRAGGGYTFEYERISDDKADVMFFRKNGPVSNLLSLANPMPYHYVKYLPKTCSIGTSLNLDGWVEFDSYDESIDEFGWTDDLFNQENSFYFANCPTDIKINWNIRPKQNNYFDVYVDTIGVSANLHLTDVNRGVIDVSVEAKTNIDCSLEWSMQSDGYISFNRNRNELDFNIKYVNPTTTIETQGTLPRIIDDIPFEINFNDIGNTDIKGLEIKTGVTFEIDRLYLLFENLENEKFDIYKIEGEILDSVITKGSNKERQVSLTIYPLIPDLIEQFKEDFEDLVEGNFEFGPYFDSPYLRLSVSKYLNLTCGSFYADVDFEKLPDIGEPTVEITHIDGIPVDEVNTISGIVEVSGNASGGTTGMPVDKVLIRIDTDEFVEAKGTESWSYTWDTTKYDDSIHIIEARCYVGEIFENDTTAVFLDNLDDPFIEITDIDGEKPYDNMTVGGIVNIKGIAEAGYFPLNQAYIKIYTAEDGYFDPVIIEDVVGLESWEYNWDTTDLANGVYKIIAHVVDTGDYISYYEIYLVVDNGPENDPPTIRIDHPSRQNPSLLLQVSDIVTIDGSATPGAPGYPIQNVQIQFNVPLYRGIANLANISYSESNWVNVTDHNSDYSYWSYEWDTTGIPFGIYEIKVRSYNGKFYSISDKSNTIKVLVWNMELDDTNLINNYASIEIYKGKNSIIQFSNLDININKISENGIMDVRFTSDLLKWETSDTDAHFRLMYNPNNNTISYDKDKFGGKITFIDTQIDCYISKSDLNIMIRTDLFELSNVGRHCKGFFSWNFETSPDISVYISVYISHGVKLYGFYGRIEWGTTIFTGGAPNINLVGERTYTLGLDIHIGDITWDIAPDWSSGWVRIGNSDQTYLDFDFTKEINGKILQTSGIIIFESGHNPFIVSWNGGVEEMNISVTGDLVLEIIHFNLNAGDMFDINDTNFESPDDSGSRFELTIDENGGKLTAEGQRYIDNDKSLDIDGQIIVKKDFIEIIGNGKSWWAQIEGLISSNPIDLNIEGSISRSAQVEGEISCLFEVEWKGKLLSIINPDLSPIENLDINLDIDSDTNLEKELNIENFAFNAKYAFINEGKLSYIGGDISFGSITRKINKDNDLFISLDFINDTNNQKDITINFCDSGSSEKELIINNFDLVIRASPFVVLKMGLGSFHSYKTKDFGLGIHIDTTEDFKNILNDAIFSANAILKLRSGGTRDISDSYAKIYLPKVDAGFRFYNTGSRTTLCPSVSTDITANINNIQLSNILDLGVSFGTKISGSQIINLNNIDRKFELQFGNTKRIKQTTCNSKQIMYSGSGSIYIYASNINLPPENGKLYISYDGATNINIDTYETNRKIISNGDIVLDRSKILNGDISFQGSFIGNFDIEDRLGAYIKLSGMAKIEDFEVYHQGNIVDFAPRIQCDYFEFSGDALFNYQGTVLSSGGFLKEGSLYLDIDATIFNVDNWKFSGTNSPNNPYFEIVDFDFNGAIIIDADWENDRYHYAEIDVHTQRSSLVDFDIQLLGLTFGTTKMTLRDGNGYTDLHAEFNSRDEYFDFDVDHQSEFNFFSFAVDDVTFKATRGNEIYGDIKAEWDGDICSGENPTYFKLSTIQGFHISAGNFEIYRLNGEIFSFIGLSIGFNGPAFIECDPINYNSQDIFYSLNCNFENVNLYGGFELIGVLSYYGSIKLDGEFNLDISQQFAYVSGTGNCNFDFEYTGIHRHRVKASSTNLDGSLNVDWTNGLDININVNSATTISTLEITRPNIEQIKIKNLEIQSTSLDLSFIDNYLYSLEIDADIQFELIQDKDLSTNEDKLKMENLEINGDLLFERPNSGEFYFESISGFSITDSAGLITIGGNTYTPGFCITGDLSIILSEELIEGDLVKKVRFSSANGINTNLFHSFNSFDIDADLSVSSGYFDFKWELDGDQNGFLGTDSSYLTGSADLELLFDNYGIQVDISGYMDSDERRVKWYEIDNPIIPFWVERTGDFDCGSNSNIDFIDYNRQQGQGPVSYNLYPLWLDTDQPYADFTWTPTDPNAGETISFDASSSYYPSGDITSYDWKWYSGDTWHNGLGAYPTHTYSSPGDYDVTLRVWHNLKSDTKIKTVTVGTGGGSAPYTPNTPQGPSTLNMDQSGIYSTSTTDPDYDQIRYYFDWGDGDTEWTGWYNSGSTASLSHSWDYPDTYNIRVKAEDTSGKQSSWSNIKQVTVTIGGSTWVRPSGHTPSSGWENEDDAYDEDGDYLDSSATSEEVVGSNDEKWTSWLELTINPILCTQIRFNAQYHYKYTPYARVEVYYNGGYHRIFDENEIFPDRQYKTINIPGGSQTISKVRIQFYIKGYYINGATAAELYDFGLYQVN